MYTLCTCTFTSVLYTHYVHFMYMYIYKGTVHSLCTSTFTSVLIMYTLCTHTFTSVLYTHYTVCMLYVYWLV